MSLFNPVPYLLLHSLYTPGTRNGIPFSRYSAIFMFFHQVLVSVGGRVVVSRAVYVVSSGFAGFSHHVSPHNENIRAVKKMCIRSSRFLCNQSKINSV